MDDIKKDVCTVTSLFAMAFVENLRKRAKENWCPEQVEMLDRLFVSELRNIPYNKVTEEEMMKWMK